MMLIKEQSMSSEGRRPVVMTVMSTPQQLLWWRLISAEFEFAVWHQCHVSDHLSVAKIHFIVLALVGTSCFYFALLLKTQQVNVWAEQVSVSY